jgi:hypothetical protein
MAKAKQPGSTGAEQGAQDEQNNPAPGGGGAADAAPPPAAPQDEPAAVAPVAPPAEDPSPAPAALVKARVLVGGAFGQCNDVVEVDADTAKAQPDVLDAAPEAVAYAESLAAQ